MYDNDDQTPTHDMHDRLAKFNWFSFIMGTILAIGIIAGVVKLVLN